MYNNKGFTLIEIIIVLSLIGILSAIAAPGLKTYYYSQKISSEAYNIRIALQLSKAKAVEDQTNVVVSFTNGTGSAGTYRAFVDSGATPDTYDTGEEILSEGSMPPTITMDQIAFGGNTWTRFNLMGLASTAGGSVRVTDADNTIFKQVSVSASGNITIQKSTDGNTWVD